MTGLPPAAIHTGSHVLLPSREIPFAQKISGKRSEVVVSDVRLFCRAVRLGSLSDGAKSLDIPKATATRQLQRLEHLLGCSLLHRSSGRFSLTEEGRTLLPLAQQIVDDIDRCLSSFQDRDRAPSGRVRVVLPCHFGLRHVMPLLGEFQRRYPHIVLAIHLTGMPVDLLADEADIAILMGEIRQENVIARTLMAQPLVLCAAPGYLARFDAIDRVEQLRGHRFSLLEFDGSNDAVPLPLADGTVRIDGVVGLRSDDPEISVNFALQQLGIALVPLECANEHIAAAALQIVLPQLELIPVKFSLTYAAARRNSQVVRILTNFLVERFCG